MNDNELIERLKQKSDGLLWQSESDYPFEVIYWSNVDNINARLLQLTDCTLETTIEVRELDKFFSQATAESDWYNDEEMAECKRYRELVNLLKTHLTDIKVYRVGETEINYYILGKTESGSIAGLSTISIET
ncbi:MAG: nuclease A inhibitor family protein [Cyanobacteriota bacterium]|nr:nuclease A inhibitor family protein [Cyanobacteriota bacterium]